MLRRICEYYVKISIQRKMCRNCIHSEWFCNNLQMFVRRHASCCVPRTVYMKFSLRKPVLSESTYILSWDFFFKLKTVLYCDTHTAYASPPHLLKCGLHIFFFINCQMSTSAKCGLADSPFLILFEGMWMRQKHARYSLEETNTQVSYEISFDMF